MAYRDRLPVLESVPASPCSSAWEDMCGDGRIRRCQSCQRDVFEVKGLSRDEAEALIADHTGATCARYFARADGRILLGDCGARLALRPSGWWLAAIGSAAAVALTLLAVQVARMPKDRARGNCDVSAIEGWDDRPLPPGDSGWKSWVETQIGPITTLTTARRK